MVPMEWSQQYELASALRPDTDSDSPTVSGRVNLV